MSAAALAVPALPAVRRRMLQAWGVALVLGACAFQLAAYAARTLPRSSGLEELAYYPSGEHLGTATLGHAESAADLAWIRAVQYYGEHRHTDNQYLHLEHVFDILTTLAPRFESAYVFGAFSLAQEGGQFPAAERLLLKGLERNPSSGWLAFETGFLYFVHPGHRDLEQAARYFEQAARLPGAPPESGRFAAYCRQNAGDLGVAYQLWAQVLAGSPNRYMREIAEREMARIRAAIEAHRASLAIDHLATPVVILRPGP